MSLRRGHDIEFHQYAHNFVKQNLIDVRLKAKGSYELGVQFAVERHLQFYTYLVARIPMQQQMNGTTTRWDQPHYENQKLNE